MNIALSISRRGAIPRLKLKLQIYCGKEIAMGPGKAALLDAIEESGSISAAARSMDMSYRRAWLLVDAMNRCFRASLVETNPGGGSRAGASVTAAGRQALADYRALVGKAESTADGPAMRGLEKVIRKTPRT